MFSSVTTLSLFGLEGRAVSVEADISDGLPVFDMVGFLAGEVKEARERVRTALRNSGILLPPKRITVNLSPANIRKSGTSYDLAVAVCLLGLLGLVPPGKASDMLVIGELGLSGSVHSVNGVLPMVIEAKNLGFDTCMIPYDNISEARAVDGMKIIGVRSLAEVMEYLKQEGAIIPEMPPETDENKGNDRVYDVDFSEVFGQESCKRAMEIAAAGMHNILLIGPPGAGKTMLAMRLPTILPSPDQSEMLEITKIYSISGKLKKGSGLMKTRPFVSVHHTASAAALVGGGSTPRPGACSLSHKGVLFLDELPEFSRPALEALRQPMEDRSVMVARAGGTYSYPADFLLCAAMNPCRCGYYPDRSKCRCTDEDVRKYLGRISGPMLDRMDICAEASRIGYSDLKMNEESEKPEPSSEIRKRVERAFEIQSRRYEGTSTRFNRDLGVKEIETFCPMTAGAEKLTQRAYESLELSARAFHRMIKVARTIADLDESDVIKEEHLAEAIAFRSLDGRYWNG